MKNLGRIKSLLDFLRTGKPSIDEILKFVALDTLFDFSAFLVFLNVIRVDGTVTMVSGFGYEKSLVALIPERTIEVDTPLNRSLRTGVIAVCGDIENYLFAGPGYSEKFFPTGFKGSIAWPIPGIGSVLTFCSQEIQLTLQHEEFLIVIGNILSLELTGARQDVDFGKRSVGKGAPTEYALTPRQWTILEAVRKGHTNVEIASELEFSESLIRQETVQIYRKLGVNGRKEILDSDSNFAERVSAQHAITI